MKYLQFIPVNTTQLEIHNWEGNWECSFSDFINENVNAFRGCTSNLTYKACEGIELKI